MASSAKLSASCSSHPKPNFRSKATNRSSNLPFKVEDDDTSEEEEEDLETQLRTATSSVVDMGTKTPNMPPTKAGEVTTITPDHATSFSQEEEELIKLERSGSLRKVVGNTSVLSQELLDLSQQTNPSQSIDAAKVGLVTPKEREQQQQEVKRAIDNRTQSSQYQDNSQYLGGNDSSQVTAMSVLMDAYEIVANENSSERNEICGVAIPDSYTDVVEESQIASGSSRIQNLTETAQQAFCGNSVEVEAVPVPRDSNLVVFKPPPRSRPKRKLPVYDLKLGTDGKKMRKVDRDTQQQIAQTLAQEAAHLAAQKKQRKVNRQQQQRVAQELAQQAATLAAQTIASPEVAKNLLLSMALVRINPRSAPSQLPPPGSTITDGFFWGTYPPLETLLRNHMREYYELSVTKCQSKHQQEFNNNLTVQIRKEATKHGWTFASNFNDKVLRDRIRCFFKTHIQNAKKRLRTMVKNPTKKANAKALVAHLQLIQRYSREDEQRKPIFNPVIGDYVKVDVPDNVDETTMRKIKPPIDIGSSMPASEENDDVSAEIAAKQVMSLGFQNLSQDADIETKEETVKTEI